MADPGSGDGAGRRGTNRRPGRPASLPVGVPAGRYFGVPVYFSGSWFIFAAFITISWAGVVRDYVQVSNYTSYVVAFSFAVLLGISVLAHELGHCVVSLALGLKVRRVVLFLLGGVSEIENEPERPAHEYLIAVAGPLVSLILAAVGAAAYPSLESGSVQRWLVVQLMVSNLLVMGFNLLPGLPLDGGRVLRAAVWQITRSQLAGTKAAVWGGRIIAIAIMALVVTGIFPRGSDQRLSTVLIALLLASFIWFNASQSMQMATMREALPRLRLADVVRPLVEVPPDISIGEAVRRARDSRAGAVLAVDRNGRPESLVSESAILTIPEHRRPWTALSEVSRELEPGPLLSDSLSGQRLIEAVQAAPASEYLVVGSDSRPVGVLVAADLAKHFNGIITAEPGAPAHT